MNEKIVIDEENLVLITSRVMNAPREAVFDCFVSKEHVDQWYGPKGCYIKTTHMDVQEGGIWNYTMYLPNGRTFDAFQIYTQIVEYELVVFDSAENQDAPKDQWFTTKIEFRDHPSGTEVIISMSYLTDEMFAQAKKFGSIRGYVSALEKVDLYLQSLAR